MNNTLILRKCLEELNKEDFRKDYVIGMLETLVEMSNPLNLAGLASKPINISPVTANNFPIRPVALVEQDEASVLDARARAAIEKVKSLTQIDG